MINECIKLKPNDGEYWETYGAALCRFGLYEEGINKLLTCQQLKYNNYGCWEFNLSFAYYNIINTFIFKIKPQLHKIWLF